MSGRHQPEHGADSAEALADVWPDDLPDFWKEPSIIQCVACSLPAVKRGYCAGHARLFEYTDHERSGGIAANE